jgi:X-Pro dipeptidyl-peptidase
VIFEQSPYRKGVWSDVPYPSVLVDQLPQISLMHPHDTRSGVSGVGLLGNLPGTLDDYYVPRGYAVLLSQSVGTADSDGCPTSGDSAETLATKAIIDWLNGRARAFDAAGQPVAASWTTGDVGMTGVSYTARCRTWWRPLASRG